jgi:hypothetical protein
MLVSLDWQFGLSGALPDGLPMKLRRQHGLDLRQAIEPFDQGSALLAILQALV